MPYCPKCRFEYKPTVEICPDCGRKLVPKLKESNKKKIEREVAEYFDPEGEPRLKLLYVTKSMIYASFLKETLEKNSITCLVKGESGYPPGCDIKIYVREEDFEKSSMIREQIIDSL